MGFETPADREQCCSDRLNPQSKADVTLLDFDVRFTPESGHSLRPSECPLWAISALAAKGDVVRQPRRPAARGARKGPLDFRHPHLGFNRVGNEAILMGGMMHLIELFRTGLSVAAPRNLWA